MITDADRLDFLDTLINRTEFQNTRRPKEYVASDMHLGQGWCSLYVRNLFGNIVKSSSQSSVRETIDAVMNGAKE
jgi:hypothetical protein